MRKSLIKNDDYVKKDEIFAAEVSTGLKANCHVCASHGVELVHVNHIRKDNVFHKCPVCKSRVGISGPHPGCNICENE